MAAGPPSSSTDDTRMSGAASLSQGTLILGERFRIEQLLGGGGMGLVYLAQQVSLGRRVAVKVLRSDLTMDDRVGDRFRREAQLLSSVDHPAVVRVIDFGQHGSSACIVMEYVEGESLEALLQREAPLAVDRAERILGQLAQGLSAIHARGIVHRDLKPDNVLLTRTPDGGEQARLLDFGIARLAQPEEAAHVTQVGMVLGTPEYLSPEQALGQPLDARSDVYSLGVLAYRMLTGRHPFTGPSAQQFVAQHIHQAAPRLTDVAPNLTPFTSLVQLVTDCLAKAPEARPQTAQAFLERLFPVPMILSTTLTGPLRTSNTQLSPVQPAPRSRLPLVLGVAVTALALAGGAVWWWYQPERRARRLIVAGRGSEALQIIDDAGADSPAMKMLEAAALHQVGRHDEELEQFKGLPDSVSPEDAAVRALADDFGHGEAPRLRRVLSAVSKAKRALPALQELATGPEGWAQWGALRFVDLEYAGQGLPLGPLYVKALDNRDCRIRAVAAKRLSELRSEEAVEPLRKLKAQPKKKGEEECGQDAAAAALQKLEKELNP